MLPEALTAAVDENEARAAAGLTLVTGTVAFAYAYFDQRYLPLQVAASLFLADFLLRVAAGLRRSPACLLARADRRPAGAVGPARSKRFAWTLGLAMAAAMTAITNSGTRGALPRTMCLTLIWMESRSGCAWAARSTACWRATVDATRAGSLRGRRLRAGRGG
jgi:hypothetical protein